MAAPPSSSSNLGTITGGSATESEAWKSRSIARTRTPDCTRADARLATIVVLPTPPLRFPIDRTGMAAGGTTGACRVVQMLTLTCLGIRYEAVGEFLEMVEARKSFVQLPLPVYTGL